MFQIRQAADRFGDAVFGPDLIGFEELMGTDVHVSVDRSAQNGAGMLLVECGQIRSAADKADPEGGFADDHGLSG